VGRAAAYVVHAVRSVWRVGRYSARKMGATKAITMRKLRTQGPFLQLLAGSKRIIRWVEILRTIPTEFEALTCNTTCPAGRCRLVKVKHLNRAKLRRRLKRNDKEQERAL